MDEVETIGGCYVVERLLGSGGMGSVYRVRDSSTGRQLALKRLRQTPDRSRASVHLLFEREFYSLAQLAHPRIIEVYDYGVDEVGAYYTMELLDGEDLRESGGQQSWPRTCTILRDVASALAILHSRRLVHRDVTPRNIRCTSDGRAKLFDFGAMAPMGVCKQVVGTPVCVPPEALMMLALDGRADLYSVGVLGYWMLTSRYPYPARELTELARRWQEPVVPPHVIDPQIPVALSDLVMQLLSPDRTVRPASAAEVIERLNAIAKLPAEQHDRVATAYLTMPALAGRDALVAEIRQRLSALALPVDSSAEQVTRAGASVLQRRHGKGVVLVFVGEAGSGRTRMLDVCVLEAKLLGAIVLRAGASDAASGDYGVARDLTRQIFAAVPEAAARAFAAHESVLQHFFGTSSDSKPNSTPPAERRQIQTALRDWIRAVARSHVLLFAIDDIDRIDEPSAALLATLAYEVERRPIAIVAAREQRAGSSVPLDLIEQAGHRLELTRLSEVDVTSLVRSVFGEAEHLTTLSRRVFEVCRGNPRVAMAALEHLVAQGKVRYEAGAWMLPPIIDDSVLPSSLMDAMVARLSMLNADARDLAEALALTDPIWLSVEDYTALTNHGSASRMLKAVMALSEKGLLVAEGDRFRFTQRVWGEWLTGTIALDRRRELHLRLAEVGRKRGDAFRLLHHLMEAGHAREAIDALLRDIGIETLEGSHAALSFLDRATLSADALGLPQVVRLTLRQRAAGMASLLSEYETFQRHAPIVLELLQRDSGFRDFQALGSAGMTDDERLRRALTIAQQRYDAAADGERGFPVAEAIRRLARFYASFAAIATAASDRELLAKLPSLRPFAALSPAISVMQTTLDLVLLVEEGRVDEARPGILELLELTERLARESDGTGLAETYNRIRYAILSQGVSVDALAGRPSALVWAEQLDGVPGHRVNAWFGRRSYYRILGRLQKSKECEERAAILQLQDGVPPLGNGTNLRTDLIARWMSDDLLGLKRISEELEPQAARFPRLRVLQHLARCHYHRLRGELDRAFAELSAALPLARPCEHKDWCYVAATEIEILALLGQTALALERARMYAEICDSAGMTTARTGIDRAAAAALIATGKLGEAQALLDQLIVEEEKKEATGVFLLSCYDMRARVAIARRDTESLKLMTERCAELYARTDSPALRFQYERLRKDAQSVSDLPELIEVRVSEQMGGAVSSAFMPETVLSALRDCLDTSEHTGRALMLLLEHAASREGHLYAYQQGTLRVLSSIGRSQPPAHLVPLLDAFAESITMHAPATTTSGTTLPTIGPDLELRKLGFEPIGLFALHDGQFVLAGMAAVRCHGPTRPAIPHDLREAIAAELLQRDDIQPMICDA